MSTRRSLVEPGSAEYPRNAWYVAAFSREVQQKNLLSRTILDEPIVMYRDRDDQVVALFDRCPHRGMPLSMGTIIKTDVIQCLYHGLEFESSGKCTRIPSQAVVPPRLGVQRYPIVETWKWVWIWMGDPALADPSLIPDHHALGLLDKRLWSRDGIYLHVNSNYLLPFENLVDATHISYLHHGLIDNGEAAAHPYRIEQDGGRVQIFRDFENEAQGQMLGGSGVLLDRELLLESFAPNLCNVQIRARPAGDVDAPWTLSRLLVALTPETLKSTHQFAGHLSDPPYSRGTPEQQDEGLRNLLSEDVVAIEAIQKLYDRLPPHKRGEFSQKADEGAIRTRRAITAMIEAERALATPSLQPVS